MSYEEARAIISNFSLEKQQQVIFDFVTDESKPYEQRLEIYLNTPEELQSRPDTTLWSHPEFDDEEWYDYDSWNRHQEIDITNVPEENGWDEAKARKWYEGCMKEGVWSFTFDW